MAARLKILMATLLYLYTRVAMKLALLVMTEDEAEKGLGSSVCLYIQKEEISDNLCLLNKTLKLTLQPVFSEINKRIH